MKKPFERLLRSRRGAADVWVAVLVSIFVFSLAYIVTYEVVAGTLYDIAIETGVDADSLSFIMTVWEDLLPFVFIISMILWGIRASQKRDYDTGWDR